MRQYDEEMISRLGIIIKNNTPESIPARNQLVEMFVEDAEQMVLKYAHNDEDIDIAYEVLMKAAEKYWDKDRNAKFSTYLEYKIREKVFEKRCRDSNISKHKFNEIKKLIKAETEFEQENGILPSELELGEMLQISVKEVRKLKVYLNQTKDVRTISDENTDEKYIADTRSTDGFRNIENNELLCKLQLALVDFSEIDRKIFLLASGLMNIEKYRWIDIKRELGLTISSDAIRNRYYKVRNELQSKYINEGYGINQEFILYNNGIDEVESYSFEKFVEGVIEAAANGQSGTDEDRRRWIKEIVNSYIGGRKEFYKAKHLKEYANYKNRKFVLLVLAFALKLSIEDVERLLKNAGLAFSPYIKGDYEVIDYIIDGKYDMEILKKYVKQ